MNISAHCIGAVVAWASKVVYLEGPALILVREDEIPAGLMRQAGATAGSVALSQRIIDTAVADGGLDQPGARIWPDGRSPSIRRILVHLIEEYAGHNGHADLLREAVDGTTDE